MASTASPRRADADLARGTTLAEIDPRSNGEWYRSPSDPYAHRPHFPGLGLPVPESLSTAGVQHASCTRVVSTMPAHPAMSCCPDCVRTITGRW